ncbi:auxin efflux carrier component 1b-related [Anaeramoeba flamelloides]|uniref:Auxin efflux carrier component 1b-related n=1 Tax=Anaeramoeba flamelloides TaxID=1746091 RepID=A0AAV7ZH36_9EUKA|nr:auxin efflux carrier component 1b-related [Anaeramoeba flamelloides]
MYVSLLIEGFNMLFCGIVGYLVVRLGMIKVEILRQLNSIVFKVGVCALSINLIAPFKFSEIDWYWCIVYAIFEMVLHAFVISIGWVFHQRDLLKISTNILTLTWSNLVIFGIPIMDSIFPKSFLIYPILASVPLILFQIPLMIVMCETIESKREIKRKMEADIENNRSSGSESQDKKDKKSTDTNIGNTSFQNNQENISENEKSLVENGQEAFELEEVDENNDRIDNENGEGKDTDSNSDSHIDSDSDIHIEGGSSSDNGITNRTQSKYSRQNDTKYELSNHKKRIIIFTIKRVFMNPIFISVVIGFIYSSSGLPYPKVIAKPAQTLANLVLPLAMITIGMFVYQHKIISSGMKTMIIYVSIKSFLVPIVSLSTFILFGIKGDSGKAAFILSVMPAGIITFQFGTEYSLRNDIITTCLIVESLIMIPILIMWILIIDATGLF